MGQWAAVVVVASEMDHLSVPFFSQCSWVGEFLGDGVRKGAM